jgi:hypothetical protein
MRDVRSCPRLNAYQEYEAELANLHFVTSLQPLVVNSNPVDVGAIQTAHVLHTPTLGSTTEFGMAPTHGHIIEEHGRFRGTSHANHICIQQKLCAFRWPSVHDQKRSAGGQFTVNSGSEGGCGAGSGGRSRDS